MQMTLLRATINHNYANVFFDGVHVHLSYDLPDVIPNHVTSGLFSKFYFPPYIVFCNFNFVQHCSTISMYYLYVHLFMCINMYTHGHIAQCIKK